MKRDAAADLELIRLCRSRAAEPMDLTASVFVLARMAKDWIREAQTQKGRAELAKAKLAELLTWGFCPPAQYQQKETAQCYENQCVPCKKAALDKIFEIQAQEAKANEC